MFPGSVTRSSLCRPLLFHRGVFDFDHAKKDCAVRGISRVDSGNNCDELLCPIVGKESLPIFEKLPKNRSVCTMANLCPSIRYINDEYREDF